MSGASVRERELLRVGGSAVDFVGEPVSHAVTNGVVGQSVHRVRVAAEIESPSPEPRCVANAFAGMETDIPSEKVTVVAVASLLYAT